MRSLSFILVLTLAASSALAQSSPHGNRLKIDCASCHVPTSWKIAPSKMAFNHNTETSFKLTGQHSALDCVDCHKSLVFSEAMPTCNSCHRDVHEGSLGPNCASCHTTKSWLIVNIDEIHQTTRFPLVGAHQNLDCSSCHSGYSRLYFPPISVTCITCHSKDYYATTTPNHMQAGFSTQCQRCHNVVDVSWGPTNFNHSFFPLVAGHAIANCFACHNQSTPDFKGLSTDCYSCHKADFMSVAFPNHVASGFSTNCKTCHTINGWAPATFDHTTTGFPLTGAHASVQCQTCHTNPTAKLNTDCYSCHTADFANTTSPNHTQLGFPHNCAQCHSTTNWTGATFDHSTTGFPLTGAHTTVQCAQCHANGYTTPPPTDCYSCHSTDYSNTTDPNHVQQGFSHTCSQCHNTTSWGDATFDHTGAGFPLTGEHTNLQCTQCHSNGYATAPSTACYSCHSGDYTNATAPVNHVAAGLPQACQNCHTISLPFTTTTFVHPAFPFQLTGAHLNVSCQSCHIGSVTNTPIDCYSCHKTDYANTTDPPHAAQGFPTTCNQCHSTTSWDNATFDHSTTGFPLTGAHTSVQCAQCHTNGYTTPPPTDCYSCHKTDYANTTDPPHAAQGFPTTCNQCHSTTSWDNATFDHSTTGFPLTGAHTSVQCAQCHTNGYTTPPPTDCYSCHSTDYNNTTDPNHVQMGYPTNCAQCHNTTGWGNATFDHTQFPIASGNHAAPPLTCNQCHTTSSNFAIFSCTTSGCHSQAETDPHHTDVSGYVYGPTSCYTCHPTGRGD